MSIIAVSDVHLGIPEANEEKFIDFLTQLDFDEVKHLVLLGDIIDLWRRDFTKAFLESSKSLRLLNDLAAETNVHYIVGNHDYYLLRLKEINGQSFPFEVSKSITLQSESNEPQGGSQNESMEYYFIHGHQLEVLCNPYYKSMKTYEAFSEQMCLVGDDTGNAADEAWKLFQSSKSILDCLKRVPDNPHAALKSMMEPPEVRIRNSNKHNVIEPMEELARSNVRNFLLGMKPNQFLIYGHTHYPTNHPGDIKFENVANTGSWGVGEDRKYWYVKIEDGKVYNLKF